MSGPQTQGVGATNVVWVLTGDDKVDHLSGPQTYINDVECNKQVIPCTTPHEGRFRLLWGNNIL